MLGGEDGSCWWAGRTTGWGMLVPGGWKRSVGVRGGRMENGMAGGRDASGAKDGAEDGVRQSGDGA